MRIRNTLKQTNNHSLKANINETGSIFKQQKLEPKNIYMSTLMFEIVRIFINLSNISAITFRLFEIFKSSNRFFF